MTNERDFHAQLDAHPEDWQTRLVFADWLQERNDPRAEGYRALGVLRLRPLQDLRAVAWATANWYYHDGSAGVMEHHPSIATASNLLPADWMGAVSDLKVKPKGSTIWVGNSRVRREVEDAVARAFAALPEARRTELLAGGGTT